MSTLTLLGIAAAVCGLVGS